MKLGDSKIVERGRAFLVRFLKLRVFVIATFIVHLGLVARHLPPSLSHAENMIASGDYAWHMIDAFEGCHFLRRGLIWGYNPYYMGGYLYGLWNSTGARAYEIAGLVFPFLPFHLAYYSWMVGMAVLTPILIAVGAWTFGLGRRGVGVGLLSAIAIFHLDNLTSYLWQFGNLAFPFTSGLGVVFVGCFYRLCTTGKWRWCIASGVLLGAIAWLHLLVLLPVAVGMATVAVVSRRTVWQRRVLIPTIASLILGALIVLPWVLILVRHLDLRVPGYIGALESSIKHFVMDFFSDRGFKRPYDRRSFSQLMIIFACLGSLNPWCSAVSQKIRPLFAASLLTLVCCYAFGHSSIFSQTQPYRYFSAAMLFLAIPAGMGGRRLVHLLRDASTNGRIATAVFALALLPSLTGYLFDIAATGPATGLSREERGVVNWLSDRGDFQGRVLCEPGRLGNAIPVYLQREVIGGLMSDQSGMKHSWANIGKHRTFGFGRSRLSLTADDWREYVVRYNCVFAILETHELIDRFRSMSPFCEQVAELGKYVVFRVQADRDGSYVVDGEGSGAHVCAEMNKISVANAPAGVFVLKYHFSDSLVPIQPGVLLSPIMMGDDPVPFISVDNRRGCPFVTISQEY